MSGHYYCWYYGASHFIAKVMPFIEQGLQENAQFLIDVSPEVQTLLERTLKANGIQPRPGTFLEAPVQEFKQLQRSHGIRGVRKGLLRCLERARMAGFQQLRLLGSVAYELERTSSNLEEFLQWEQAFHEASRDLPITTVCMYDLALHVDPGRLACCHDEALPEPVETPPSRASQRKIPIHRTDGKHVTEQR